MAKKSSRKTRSGKLRSRRPRGQRSQSILVPVSPSLAAAACTPMNGYSHAGAPSPDSVLRVSKGKVYIRQINKAIEQENANLSAHALATFTNHPSLPYLIYAAPELSNGKSMLLSPVPLTPSATVRVAANYGTKVYYRPAKTIPTHTVKAGVYKRYMGDDASEANLNKVGVYP